MEGSGYWLVLGIAILIIIGEHLYILWVQGQVLLTIPKTTEIVGLESKVYIFPKWSYSGFPRFARRQKFYADIFIVDNAIYVFRAYKILNKLKIYADFHSIYVNNMDIPLVCQNSISPFIQDSFNRVDAIEMDGRRISIEFSNFIKSGNSIFRCWTLQFIFPDVRDNDAYRGLLRFQRYHQQFVQWNKMQQLRNKR